MDTYHAEAIVNPQGQIVVTLPFPAGERVDVVVMPHDERTEAIEEKDWKTFGLRKFLEGYDEEDSVYDSLP
jgi:hypothetical protein